MAFHPLFIGKINIMPIVFTCKQCGKICRKSPSRVKREVCSLECLWKSRHVPVAIRFWRFVNKTDGCWLWTNCIKSPDSRYGTIKCDDGKNRPAHRVSWELANGPIPDGLMVCHHCDVPLCVNPAHLFLGTGSDNMRDAMAKGRLTQLRMNRNRLLTDDDVEAMRQMLKTGATKRAIGIQFNVCEHTVAIRLRRPYKEGATH